MNLKECVLALNTHCSVKLCSNKQTNRNLELTYTVRVVYCCSLG